jgi:hypothetical protein
LQVLSLLSAVSFNQPNFSSTTIWHSNAITFANESIVSFNPDVIFITTNKTIYITHKRNSETFMWYEGNSNPTRITSDEFSSPHSLFVTSNGDIYVDDGWLNDRVQKWITQNNTWIAVHHRM